MHLSVRIPAIARRVVDAMPVVLRSWVSYYRADSRFSMINVERTRNEIVSGLDPLLTEPLWHTQTSAGPLMSRTEFNQRLRVAILRAGYLGLHSSPKRSILDIGSGAGFFVAVAKHFGHDCIGCDLPLASLSASTAAIYEACNRALGCWGDRRLLVVKPFEPLALDGTYDLITAGLICFNEYGTNRSWSRPEWEFLFEDVERHLNPGGRLFLELNEQKCFGAQRWYDSATLEFFRSVATVNRNKILYTSRMFPPTPRVTSGAASQPTAR